MRRSTMRAALSGLCTLLITAACASFPHDVAEGVANTWAPPSAAAARYLIDEYGLPDDATPGRMTWNHKGVWKRTVVWNRKPIYDSPVDLAVMKQTVDYKLDQDQTAALLAFSGSLEIDMTRGELSSRAGREELDYLTLNLADELARSRITIFQAQLAYARQVELAQAGKKTPYMTGLLFPTAP